MREFNNVNSIGFYRKYLIKKNNMDTCSASSLLAEQENKPLIDIIAYCLNPNHFHLLAREISENGISKFMHKVAGGYTRYFNERYNRAGCLFQGKYKAKEITSTYDLMKVSVYVNCNSEIHGIAKAENWPWSSYLDYIGIRKGTLCNKKDVYEEFINIEEIKKLKEYIKFCNELIPEIKAVKNLEKHGLE
jgi:REP element-mobilizing transposase RayT